VAIPAALVLMKFGPAIEQSTFSLAVPVQLASSPSSANGMVASHPRFCETLAVACTAKVHVLYPDGPLIVTV
jgi:hypothetical protein